jgi:glycosyltransferase involved in cell wall biosynthesis
MESGSKKKNVLQITHCWGGGIEIYVQDLIDLLGSDYDIYTLKCEKNRLILEYPKDVGDVAYFDLPSKVGFLDITNTDYKKVFEHILVENNIDLVHVNITLGHTFDVFESAKSLSIPLVYTVHDFFYICPSIHLVDRDGVHCKTCRHGSEDRDCIYNHPYVMEKGFSGDSLYRWRKKFKAVKDSIDLYVFPSESCKEIFTDYYDIENDRCRVIPHGTSISQAPTKSVHHDELRVGIIGTMLKHKGEALYREILKSVANELIWFYHFGDGILNDDKLIKVGAYQRSDISQLLRDNEIDLVLLLSTWPETFSYTLSESIASGLPAIVTNFGAQSERVEKHGAGWVVDFNSPQEVSALLNRLLINKSEITRKQIHLDSLNLYSMGEMKTEYLTVYDGLLFDSGKNRKLPVNKRKEIALGHNFKASVTQKKLSTDKELSAQERFNETVRDLNS